MADGFDIPTLAEQAAAAEEERRRQIAGQIQGQTRTVVGPGTPEQRAAQDALLRMQGGSAPVLDAQLPTGASDLSPETRDIVEARVTPPEPVGSDDGVNPERAAARSALDSLSGGRAPSRGGGSPALGGLGRQLGQAQKRMEKAQAEKERQLDRLDQAERNVAAQGAVQAGVEARAADEQADVLAQARQAMMDSVESRRELEAERQAAVEAKRAEIEAARDDYVESKVRKPVGIGIMGGIAMALEAVSNANMAIAGGAPSNSISRMVEGAIRRDSERQLEEIERKGEKLTGLERDAARVLGEYETRDDKMAVLDLGNLEATRTKLQEAQLRATSDAKKSQIGALLEQTEGMIAQRRAQLAMADEQAAAKQVVGLQQAVARAQRGPKTVNPLGNVTFNANATKEDREAVREKLTVARPFIDTLQELESMTSTGSLTERGKADIMLNEIFGRQAQILGQGALSADERKSLEEAFKDPTELNLADANEILASARRRAQRQLKQFMIDNNVARDASSDFRPE